jgi:ferric-dicitrate binding protein FerR (iron transport regulator)
LDHELDEAAGAGLQSHLDRCAVCRREWVRLQALEAALGGLVVPAPPGLAEHVTARLRRPRRWSGWQTAALAACLVLGIALGGTMGHSFYGPAATEAGVEAASLDVFHDFPQGSLGAMVASYQLEEGNGIQP